MERSGQLADELQCSVHAYLYLGLPLLTTLGSDQDDAVGTTHTIDSCCRGILQHGDALYRGDVDAVHRALDTVDEDERVAVVPRAHATDDDLRVFLTRHTRGAHRHHARQITGQSGTDAAHTTGALKHLTCGLGDGADHRGFLLLTVADDDDLTEILVIVAQGDAHGMLTSYLHVLWQHTDIRYLQRGTGTFDIDDKVAVQIGDGTIGRTAFHDGGTDNRLTFLVYHTTFDRVLLLGLYAHSKE